MAPHQTVTYGSPEAYAVRYPPHDPRPPAAGLLGLLQTNDTLTLIGSTAVVFGVQRLVPTYDQTWYNSLKKPSWNPPNWVFPAVWIPLKLMQSAAAWLLIKEAHSTEQLALPLSVFGAQLALGNWWNVVFFGQHKINESLPWMGAFWVSVAGTIAAFSKVSDRAGQLVTPTLVWVTIAAALNYEIVRLNQNPPPINPAAGDKTFAEVVKSQTD